ncbi:hypothetical protein HYH03_011115 [Edaphochlamys debaryana]|uniref:Uncharacterized protein n=1 Tax=Edaphochlamys debaryana TaxID=47281 RepID=A0A835XSN9_9CHLO|nr:hypothetical protein HYH03_011115 [Edaphochlamys debaryana]|eukprot:KAG2490487.1 hypothetical protein HYH03_011115 [Edaphochlamys debaryana]
MDNEQAQSSPQLCVNNCGFFANVGCGGLCSKCHRSTQPAPSATPTPKPAPVAEVSVAKPAQEAQPIVSSSPASASSPTPEASTSGAGDVAPPATKACPTRCLACKKKVGLTGFTCKCGDVFCGQHRYAESHQCPFDYKGVAKAQLEKLNPVIQAQKVQKL